jgi:hypothetical protein
VILLVACDARAGTLDDLAREFWQWRALQQPLSHDDIPRIERPVGWVPDWSRATVETRRRELASFVAQWKAIDVSASDVPTQVDYRLMGSALTRVRWELDITRGWRRNPLFYVAQTMGGVFGLPPPPFNEARSRQMVLHLQSIPSTVAAPRENLDEPVRAFAELAIGELRNVRERLTTVARELAPQLSSAAARELPDATERAIVALEEYRGWLQAGLGRMDTRTAVGQDQYVWFQSNVALVPDAPQELLAMGRQEWERAVSFEAYEKARNAGLPELPIVATVEAHLKKQAEDEEAVRQFLSEKRLLSVPPWVKRYRNLLSPPYLAPLTSMGVTDDLTGPSRLDQDGVHYIRRPSPDLPYLYLSMARDPRGIIVHEGIPGHDLQMVLSWAHENPIRRHYYDSNSHEGIGFYVEEMMLQAGLFDSPPRAREIIYNFMRLRALRVEVDVRLATGEFTIPQGADYLARTVPMDRATALEEAAWFAAGPGQAITCQISKRQILRLLADARRIRGDAFVLRAFPDFVWKNGNVPLSLQRWEMPGLRDDVDTIDRSAAASIGSPQR